MTMMFLFKPTKLAYPSPYLGTRLSRI